MFLLIMLMECLEDRGTYIILFYSDNGGGGEFASVTKVIKAAETSILLETTPSALADILAEVLDNSVDYELV